MLYITVFHKAIVGIEDATGHLLNSNALTTSNTSVMTSAAISVLQERCTALTEQLAAKDESERTLRLSLEEVEEQHRLEMAGIRLELDATKTALKNEQVERRAVEDERRKLVAEAISLKNELVKKVSEAVNKSTAELRLHELQLSEELVLCKAELRQLQETGSTNEKSVADYNAARRELRSLREKVISQEEEIANVVAQLEAAQRDLYRATLPDVKKDTVIEEGLQETYKNLEDKIQDLESENTILRGKLLADRSAMAASSASSIDYAKLQKIFTNIRGIDSALALFSVDFSEYEDVDGLEERLRSKSLLGELDTDYYDFLTAILISKLFFIKNEIDAIKSKSHTYDIIIFCSLFHYVNNIRLQLIQGIFDIK
jgi:chromosome segregation ATPase